MTLRSREKGKNRGSLRTAESKSDGGGSNGVATQNQIHSEDLKLYGEFIRLARKVRMHNTPKGAFSDENYSTKGNE